MAEFSKVAFSYLFCLERDKLVSKVCVACGDPTGSQEDRMMALRAADRWPHQDEWFYCEDCANEKFRKRLSIVPAKIYATGAGCPLEQRGDDDGDPSIENAVRCLEDG